LWLLEEWANKSYSELQAEASKLRVIMMMGMEDQLVCDTLVKRRHNFARRKKEVGPLPKIVCQMLIRGLIPLNPFMTWD